MQFIEEGSIGGEAELAQTSEVSFGACELGGMGHYRGVYEDVEGF